ncbi:putative leucine-rich repeat-containing protein DDB_G0290503 isoform X2 [Bombus pyrosoma]|uniref:putative leucine-rich repeat-containing protein DDB_G0290503 isoform X2 n=1 Tax=Bombus pyrosoma TaxID=396416 RepID=UPI001CB8D92A|nr:putative leucine-rich repeat-containing protein DDB_G0290503 isoform X2 [Bombus pyrosoma]
MYPHLRKENLPVEYSSKSSKSSSDISVKLNSMLKNAIDRKHRETLRNENFQVHHRNAISVPLFPKKRYAKCGKKLRRSSKNAETVKMSPACKKFTRTIDDCKKYLKELHDSNKNLGLVCSSSEISNESSIKNFWSDTQQRRGVRGKDAINVSEKLEKNNRNEYGKEENKGEKKLEKIDRKQQSNEQRLELSNAIYPVLQLIDKRLLPPKMNISFCADVFPQQLTSKMLVSCEPRKKLKTSQEALYQVKKKLESLHNVLRMYELQNIDMKASENQRDNSNKMNSVCKNIVSTLVSVTTDTDNLKNTENIEIKANGNIRNNSKEIQRTTSNSSEQYESDETTRSSVASIRNYSNMFNAYHVNNINDPYCLLTRNDEAKISSTNGHELQIIPNNQTVYSSSVKYERIPERIYYTISSDSSEEKEVKKKTVISENCIPIPDDVYTKGNQAKQFNGSDQYPVAMETDEDAIISPASSHTEVSKDSELDDKPTALLLQEALQFKRALLTRVELEKICYIDEKKEEMSNESVSDYGRYSYVNNNLQSKFLDIISEEQSVSSSTEKNSKTYMFFNLKQDLNQRNEIKDLDTCKKYLDSKQNLSSPSEYFSFSNIIQEGNEIKNKLSLPKHNHFQGNEIVPSNLRIRYLNDILNESDEKLIKFVSCLNTTEANMNEERTCYGYDHEKENFKEHFTRMNDVNEFLNRDTNSVELFSQNLDETPSSEKIEDSNNEITSNFLNSESLKQCTNVRITKDTGTDISNLKLSTLDNEKYEDQEILSCNSNLTLKRNPGACSLIEQTLLHRNINKTLEMHGIVENEDPIYELSPSESKETSCGTNLIRDSLTSTINQSNDSNIPEPPSVTVLINKSLDKEKLELDWLNVNNNFSDDTINEKDVKTCSTNTITLQKYDTTNINNYNKTETNYNKHDHFQDEKNSVTQNLFTNLNKKELIKETDFLKSYSNLISPHSSMYFTDEASSSTTKLNNTHSKNLKGYLHSNLYTQNNKENTLHSKHDNLKGIASDTKKTNIMVTDKSFIKLSNDEFDMKQNLSKFQGKMSNKNNSLSSKSCTENIDTIKEAKALKEEKEIRNNRSPVAYAVDNYNLLFAENVPIDETLPNLPANDMKTLHLEQNIISSNLSPRQVSPRETKKDNIMKRTNATMKSWSHENYTLKSEKLKRSIASRNIKGLKSDLLNTVQIKAEDSTNTTYPKLSDLSAEPRCNTGDSVKLDRKRSRSQVSFRTNESPKEITPRSHEYPSNTNFINYTQSLETKLKSKGPFKSLSPIPRTSSKSCIPILKSRLEAARKTENESRPKSPMRGPLTMTMFWRDNPSNNKDQNEIDEIQVEGKSRNTDSCIEEVNSFVGKVNDADNHKQDLIKTSQIAQNINENAGNDIIAQEQMVIYVNIFTKYDHASTKIVDPNKFLEYIKNREVSVQKMEENQANKKYDELRGIPTENEKDRIHKIVTVVSTVINGNELDQTTSTNLSVPKTQKDSVSNILLNSKLKNLCFLSVEQKEVDVTAKPSVIDTSTSISDLENISKTTKTTLNKFQICGTPKELSNEEYIALLEILHQESNFMHLEELQNICKKLTSKH